LEKSGFTPIGKLMVAPKHAFLLDLEGRLCLKSGCYQGKPAWVKVAWASTGWIFEEVAVIHYPRIFVGPNLTLVKSSFFDFRSHTLQYHIRVSGVSSATK
jgi:hypothetical protein